MQKKIIVTCGDINGIGPEIAIKAIGENFDPLKYKFVFVIPKNIFERYYFALSAEFEYAFSDNISEDTNIVDIIDIGDTPMDIGHPTVESGKTAYKAIQKALRLSEFDVQNCVVVTSPISKTAFELAGINFPGHTELLAEYFNVRNFAMIFIGEEFNAALATIHIPLMEVASHISKSSLVNFFGFLKNVLTNDFKITQPRIAVLGLNPHAGENGRIGTEEENIISPAVEKFPFVEGPFVPDAFFGTKKYRQFDIVVGMYHDQVLIPFKMLEMNSGVNFTAGLPIVRTSPDHGTAYDIAGKLIANPGSMSKAIQYGVQISENREAK
jgi:4-hydroxythreonine-4-phosphate dehydrogenase